MTRFRADAVVDSSAAPSAAMGSLMSSAGTDATSVNCLSPNWSGAKPTYRVSLPSPSTRFVCVVIPDSPASICVRASSPSSVPYSPSATLVRWSTICWSGWLTISPASFRM